MTSTICKWPILSGLDDELASCIRLFAVFGHDASEAIFITEDDQVFGLGTNRSGCLGLVVKTTAYIQPKKIDSLSGIGIKSLAYGYGTDKHGPHVVGLTESGRVFSWGRNNYFQLGHGINSSRGLPAEVLGLFGHHVVQVACGAFHTLALTSEGEVFAWGYNSNDQVGSGSTTHQPKPVKVKFDHIYKGQLKAVAIACGYSSSMAVLDSDQLYSWGHNRFGELGMGSIKNRFVPILVASLSERQSPVDIHKVVCGHSHVLALATDGSIYAWGQSNFGQLGTGYTTNHNTPVKVGPAGVRFVDVGASLYNNLSVAVSDDNRCWVWGQCRALTGARSFGGQTSSGSVCDGLVCRRRVRRLWTAGCHFEVGDCLS